jgi:hypothetical protein
MYKERRNLLDVLKTELAFLEKGGYSGRCANGGDVSSFSKILQPAQITTRKSTPSRVANVS